MTSSCTVYVRKERKAQIIRFGGKCMNGGCSSTKNLQFAHLKKTNLSGMGRGSYNRIRDVRDHPECYALLCKECHKLFDSGQLPTL